MGGFRIPTPLAVAAWAASGLAVLSYTYLAYKETAHGAEPNKGAQLSGLTTNQKVLDTELLNMLPELKKNKLTRGRFSK